MSYSGEVAGQAARAHDFTAFEIHDIANDAVDPESTLRLAIMAFAFEMCRRHRVNGDGAAGYVAAGVLIGERDRSKAPAIAHGSAWSGSVVCSPPCRLSRWL